MPLPPLYFPEHGLMPVGAAPTLPAAVSLNALAGSNAGFVWTAPEACTITGIKFKLTGVTGTPGFLRVSAQGVTLTTGLASGTILGATNNAKLDFTPVAGDVGVYAATFDEPITLAEGEQVAFVIAPQSGTWDASNLVQIVLRLTGVETRAMPYPTNNSTKASAGLQQVIIVGTVRSYGCCLLAIPTSGSLTSGSNPNEIATKFVAPDYLGSMACIGIELGANVSASRALDVILYDGASTALATRSISNTSILIAGAMTQEILLPAKIALTPGATYYASVKVTHASGTITIYGNQWASTGDKDAYLPGTTAHWAERAGGGWTERTTYLPCIRPIIVDQAANTGGLKQLSRTPLARRAA